MKIHEYQAKTLFRNYDITVPEGAVCTAAGDIDPILEKTGLPAVVKAQIHAGGRGKGGGVRVCNSREEAQQAAAAILGMQLITAQTGDSGQQVQTLLVEQGVDIAKELYLSLTIDRKSAAITFIASRDGGMDIETVAAKTPERIITVQVNPLAGIQPHHIRRILFDLEIPAPLKKPFSALITRMYRLFTEYDCSLIEINPLVITRDDNLVAIDAKMEIDSNSLFRHPDIQAMRDPAEEDALEAEAAAFNLNYINLDGNIGNMVNGAGLAMATMDIIKQAGASPANFLDVGGGADAEMIENGFRIILSDPNVQGILINIFGGILRCDTLATGVVEAARKTDLTVPVVIRMEGTNVEEGRRILADSGLNLINATTLADAAEKTAAMVNN